MLNPAHRSLSALTLLLVLAACTEDQPTALSGGASPASSLSAVLSSTPDIIVNTTSDVADFGGSQQVADLPGPDGVTSLREAIIAADNTSGSQLVGFNIPPGDPGFDGAVFRIMPTRNLPAITDGGTLIVGSIQTLFSGDTNPFGPEITVDFTQQGDGGGFRITSAYNWIHGLTITRAQVMGVSIVGLGAVHNRITGCFITENGSGRHGGEDGVNIVQGASYTVIGGASPIERNIISGNLRAGIIISSGVGPVDPNLTHHNVVIGNFIGTDGTGTQPWPNSAPGIGGPGGIGIFHATNNRIGGPGPGEGNLISGNGWTAVVLAEGSSNTTVTGNLIGTDATGARALGNAIGGIVIRGEPTLPNASHGNLITRNVISGNLGVGILLWRGAYDNAIRGNMIGTDLSGMNPVGNQAQGVLILTGAHDNSIGDLDLSGGNIIAANGATGVLVTDNSYDNRIVGNSIASNGGRGVLVTSNSYHNRIVGNSIHSNTALGIDLNGDGVTLNDPGDTDTGPNSLMNFPILISARATPGQLFIKGTLDTPSPETVTIELFANPVPIPGADPSGHGEGAVLLGSVRPNARGDFSTTLPRVAVGTLISATATDAHGNTSEFSANIVARFP